MANSTGTAVLPRSHRDQACVERSGAAGRTAVDPLPGEPQPFPVAPVTPPARTAAGARAMRRRRARLAADRRPPSGVLPSSPRRSAVVVADRGDEVDDRVYQIGRWARLACTLSVAATAVLVAVVLLSSGSTQVIGSVVVHPGDTLWSVAQRADPGADPQGVVDRIRELNDLPGDAVMAGSVLKVPMSTP